MGGAGDTGGGCSGGAIAGGAGGAGGSDGRTGAVIAGRTGGAGGRTGVAGAAGVLAALHDGQRSLHTLCCAHMGAWHPVQAERQLRHWIALQTTH